MTGYNTPKDTTHTARADRLVNRLPSVLAMAQEKKRASNSPGLNQIMRPDLSQAGSSEEVMRIVRRDRAKAMRRGF